jgi:hypothetical protein
MKPDAVGDLAARWDQFRGNASDTIWTLERRSFRIPVPELL